LCDQVNCSIFDKAYGIERQAFWCHNSERDPERVIVRYSSAENLFTLVASTAIPAGLFVISLTVVCCLQVGKKKQVDPAVGVSDEAVKDVDKKNAKKVPKGSASKDTLHGRKMTEEDR
jgi:hypothetical protein